MDRYTMYVDSATGQVTPATDEQVENQKAQILYIAGIEAVIPPPIWVGLTKAKCYFSLANLRARMGALL